MTMRLTQILISTLTILMLGSCGTAEESHGHAHDEEEQVLVYTHYTDSTEVFVEFPLLQVGSASRFLAHLTYLNDFSPVTEGTVDVILRQKGAEKARFRVSEATRDGLFTPVVQPRTAGVYELSISLTNNRVTKEHNLGEIEVYAADAHPHVEQVEPAGDITFLKEQQWTQPFATTLVTSKALRLSVPAFAEVIAPAQQRARVHAPQAGYLFLESDIAAGTTVTQGQKLGTLVARAESNQDLISLQLELADSQAQEKLARAEIKRLQQLVKSGAIPASRLAQAEAKLASVVNQRKATEARIAQTQFRGTNGGIAIVSPVDGVIIDNAGYDGMYVNAEQDLFSIAAADERWLQLHIPERFSQHVNAIDGAWFMQNDVTHQLDAASGARVVSRSYQVNPNTRTFAVILAFSTEQWSPMVGARVSAFAMLQEQRMATAVPVSAVIRQEGKDVVFVHTSGETFERREVELGIRDGDWVAVTQGIKAGERVVSTGAYEVRLAAMAGDDIGHGHAH